MLRYEKEKPNTSLNTYHNSSFESGLNKADSVIFKNLKKARPAKDVIQNNKRILAVLANKKLNGELKPVQKIEENSLAASDAYSYGNETKKESTKLRTQDSTTDHMDENQSDNMEGDKAIYDKLSSDSYPTQQKKAHQHKTLTKNMNDDLRDEEEDKQYGSDKRINEYDSTLANDFDSPIDYKATSASPNLNGSAMSKEVGLDDRTSILKDDEKDDKDQNTASTTPKFPLSAAKTIIHYGKYLSEYEESEILNYMVVYYINKNIKLDEGSKPGKSGKKTK